MLLDINDSQNSHNVRPFALFMNKVYHNIYYDSNILTYKFNQRL